MAVVVSSAQPRLDLLGPILQDGVDKKHFVADQVLPTILVDKKAGAIPTWLYTDAQILNIKHGRGMPFARIQSQIDTRAYTCLESGVEEGLTPEDFDIISQDNAELQLARKLANVVLRQRDLALAQICMGSSGGYSGETTFANQITNAIAAWGSGSDKPYTDFAAAKLALFKRIGAPANAAIMSYGAYMNLMQSTQLQNQVRAVLGYSGDFANIAVKLEQDPNMLANVFGLERIIVARGTYNTANEGQTASYSNIWLDNYCLVFRGFSENDALNHDIGLGRMFVYDQSNAINELATGTVDTKKGLIFEMYPEPKTNSNMYRAREFISQTFTSVTAGQLIKGN